MNRKHAIGVLALPTLAVLYILCCFLALGIRSASLEAYGHDVAYFLVCFIIFGVPLYVWFFLGIVSFSVGAWVLITSQARHRSRIVIGMSILFSMLPILFLTLGYYFLGYRGE